MHISSPISVTSARAGWLATVNCIPSNTHTHAHGIGVHLHADTSIVFVCVRASQCAHALTRNSFDRKSSRYLHYSSNCTRLLTRAYSYVHTPSSMQTANLQLARDVILPLHQEAAGGARHTSAQELLTFIDQTGSYAGLTSALSCSRFRTLW